MTTIHQRTGHIRCLGWLMGVSLGVAATFGVGTAASAMTASPSEVQPAAQSADSSEITPEHIEGAAANWRTPATTPK